jgi:menaquinone-dependent protoporphyrinogen oxidase
MTVLVSAASKHGATTEIASALAEGITRRGVVAEVRDPAEVAGVTGYDAVVLGSAVSMGHWLGEAKELVSRVGADLRDRPVWLFSSGPIGEPPKPEEEAVDVWAETIASSLSASRTGA